MKHAIIYILSESLSAFYEFLQRGEKSASAQTVLWSDKAFFGGGTVATIAVVNSDPPTVTASLDHKGMEYPLTGRDQVLGNYHFQTPDGEFVAHLRREPDPNLLHCQTCGFHLFEEVKTKRVERHSVSISTNGEVEYRLAGSDKPFGFPSTSTTFVCIDCPTEYTLTEGSLHIIGEATRETAADTYHLPLDEEQFRRQRELVLRLLYEAEKAPTSDYEQLEGLCNLLDCIADQAHDVHGLDVLLTEDRQCSSCPAKPDSCQKDQKGCSFQQEESGQFDLSALEKAIVIAFDRRGVLLNAIQDLSDIEPGKVYLRFSNGSYSIHGLNEDGYLTPNTSTILVTVGKGKSVHCPDIETAAEAVAKFLLPSVGLVPTPAQLINKYGQWGEHPSYPRADWQFEVINRDTGSSYWDWAASQVEQNNDERESSGYKPLSQAVLVDGTEVELLETPGTGGFEECGKCRKEFKISGAPKAWAILHTLVLICPDCSPKEA